MKEVTDLMQLLSDAKLALDRETECLLSGDNSEIVALIAIKTQVASNLMEAQPVVAHIFHGADEDERTRLREAFDAMLDAATRNEAVLRGAMRGVHIVSAAFSEGTSPYDEGGQGKPNAWAGGNYDQIA